MSHHALVIGGTGMLRGATQSLVNRGRHVSVVSRDRAKFSRLLEDTAIECRDRLHQIPVDYRDTDNLADGINASIDQYGPIQSAVLWIHASAPDAPGAVADLLSRRSDQGTTIIEVLSSGSSQVLGYSASLERPNVAHRRVVLGFVREDECSRWLTDNEISGGVIRAIDAANPLSVVGQVEPWSQRP